MNGIDRLIAERTKPGKPVAVEQDALGWLLVDARGNPVGAPDYYKSKRAANAALKAQQ
jgi:hypothetical protein